MDPIPLVIALLGIAGVGTIGLVGIGGLMVIASRAHRQGLQQWCDLEGHTLAGSTVTGQRNGMPFSIRAVGTSVEVTLPPLVGLEVDPGTTEDQALGVPAFSKRAQHSVNEGGLRRLSHGLRQHEFTARPSGLRLTLPYGFDVGGILQALIVAEGVYEAAPYQESSVDALASHIVSDPHVGYVVERLRKLPPEQHARFAELLEARTEGPIQVWVGILRGDWGVVDSFLAGNDADALAEAAGATLQAGPRLQEAMGAVVRIPDGAPWQRFVRLIADGGWGGESANLQALIHYARDEGGPRGILLAKALCQRLDDVPGDQEAVVRQLLTFDTSWIEQPVIEWLSVRGTVDSISALNAVGRRSGAWDAAQDRARRAIAMIQDRVEGGAGGLAIVDAEHGEVSLATSNEGALSVAQRARPHRERQ